MIQLSIPLKFGLRWANNVAPVAKHFFGLTRFFFGSVVFLVLSLLLVPHEAQAHGIHEPPGLSVPISEIVEPVDVLPLDSSEVSVSNCVSCSAASGCLVLYSAEIVYLFDACGSKDRFRAISTVVVCQMAQTGLRRPPRQNS